MRNTIAIIIGAGLIIGAVFAQEKSESLEGVLAELESYQAPAAVLEEPVLKAAAMAEEPVVEEVAVAEEAVVEEVAMVEEPVVEEVAVAEEAVVEEVAVAEEAVVEEVDIEAAMGDSRELYVGGEFEKAQKGFEEIVKLDPENVLARIYLRKILERDQRIAEVKGMKEVDAAWSTGLVLRSYSIVSDALENMGLDSVGGSVDVSGKFPEVGFPKGATAVYQPKMEKIFVRNTRENLAVLEEILAAMDAANLSTDVDQVEIETKFIEVSEGTLEELGFEWRHTSFSDLDAAEQDRRVESAWKTYGTPNGENLWFEDYREDDFVGIEAVVGAHPDWSLSKAEKYVKDTFDVMHAATSYADRRTEYVAQKETYIRESLSDSGVDLGGDVRLRPGQRLFDDALRGGVDNPALPFSRPGSLGAGRTPASRDRAGSHDAWSTFRFEDTFNAQPDYLTIQGRGSTPFDLLISALDQSSGSDILSAPRVVTRDGEEAIIRVGELHSYPEIYETASTQATPIHINYQEFEETLLGIELSVTPYLDGDQIELELAPRITELAGWQKYEVAPGGSVYNHRQNKATAPYTYVGVDVVASLPIFKVREIDTVVTIADGGTIGMGGLISEKVETFEDRVPLLGSLPLVGRLFRNEGERVLKRNMLMFVTARKVESTGRIRTDRSFE